MAKEQHFDGLGVAVGIAIGSAYVRESGAVDVPERRITKKEVEKEQKRLKVAVRLARRQIRLLQSRAAAKSGAAGEELTDAKTYLIGSFPLRFTSSGRIASMLVGMQLDDLGIDYLDKRNGYIDAVTLPRVNRLARRASRRRGAERRRRRRAGGN